MLIIEAIVWQLIRSYIRNTKIVHYLARECYAAARIMMSVHQYKRDLFPQVWLFTSFLFFRTNAALIQGEERCQCVNTEGPDPKCDSLYPPTLRSRDVVTHVRVCLL